MLEKETIQKEKNNLLIEISKSNYDLSLLDRLKNFYKQYSDVDKDKQLEVECRIWIGDIYEKNNFFKEALKEYQFALSNLSSDNPYYANVVQNKADVLFNLGRKREGLTLIENYLKGNKLNVFTMINLLYWYVNHANSPKKFTEQFKGTIDFIANELGILINGESIKEDVLYLYNVNKFENLKYMEIGLSMEGSSQTEKIEILKTYLATKPIKFYEKLAKESIKALKNQ